MSFDVVTYGTEVNPFDNMLVESLGAVGSDFVLRESDTPPPDECCCGAVDCSGFDCDCLPIATPCRTPLNLWWRMRAGSFSCVANCNNDLQDSIDSAGGGIGGVGIKIEQGFQTDCCQYIHGIGAPVTLSCCDCNSTPPMSTPVSGGFVITLSCVEINNVCTVRAEAIMCSSVGYSVNGFDHTKGKLNPNILVLDTTIGGLGNGLNCCNVGSVEFEVANEPF